MVTFNLLYSSGRHSAQRYAGVTTEMWGGVFETFAQLIVPLSFRALRALNFLNLN